MGSEQLHEDPAQLSPETIDRHRAIASLMEELEAVDWYDQRVGATDDAGLAAILAHNRDEEKEHAAMLIEWIRRHDPTFDDELRTYLFTSGPLLEREPISGDRSPPDGWDRSDQAESLGIGSLRKEHG